jgi:hypothetical protein
LSTGLYKSYINELLLTLERNRVGTHIGTTYVGRPTVADDLALLANSTSDLQLMLDVTNSFANREKICYSSREKYNYNDNSDEKYSF